MEYCVTKTEICVYSNARKIGVETFHQLFERTNQFDNLLLDESHSLKRMEHQTKTLN